MSGMRNVLLLRMAFCTLLEHCVFLEREQNAVSLMVLPRYGSKGCSLTLPLRDFDSIVLVAVQGHAIEF